jgi:hypothetical protein
MGYKLSPMIPLPSPCSRTFRPFAIPVICCILFGVFFTIPTSTAVTVTERGSWPGYRRGQGVGIQVVDKYAYLVAQEAGLMIFDVSNPANPIRLSEFEIQGQTIACRVAGNRAYLTSDTITNSSLTVLDVTDPKNPVQIGGLKTFGFPSGLEIVGDRLYVGFESVMRIYDIRTSVDPIFLGQYLTTGSIHEIQVSQDRAYLASDSTGLEIVDVRNPAQPTLIGRFQNFPGQNRAHGVRVLNGKAFVAEADFGLDVVDISDPRNPSLIHTYKTGGVFNVETDGSYAYLGSASGGLKILDLNSGTSGPTLLTNRFSGRATIVGNLVYVANSDGFKIIDASNHFTYKIIGGFETFGQAIAVQVYANRAYVADGTEGLRIIDVSTPDSPTLLGALATEQSIYTVFVDDRAAYTGSDQQFQIADVNDPSSPKLLSSYFTEIQSLRIQVVKTNAYVLILARGLAILDISNPTNPIKTGTVNTSQSANDFQVVANYAYIADGAAGLQIVDVRDPHNPLLVAHFDTKGVARSVQIINNRVYLSVDTRLQILDVSTVTTPTLIGTFDTGDYLAQSRVAGNYAYLFVAPDRVELIDLNDPIHPSLLATVHVPDARSLYVSGPFIYVAAGVEGLRIFQVEITRDLGFGIRRAGPAFELFWNEDGKNFQLQKSDPLISPMQWKDINTPAVFAGGEYRVPQDVSGNNAYFRLIQR